MQTVIRNWRLALLCLFQPFYALAEFDAYTQKMKLALFTRQPENLPQGYQWEGQRVETNTGVAFCRPFAQDRQQAVRQIVIAFNDLHGSDETYSLAWEADIVAVARSASPYDNWGGAPQYDIFYANARRLDAVTQCRSAAVPQCRSMRRYIERL